MFITLYVYALLISIILLCIGAIIRLFFECRDNKFGDGYFMMIMAVIPLATIALAIGGLYGITHTIIK